MEEEKRKRLIRTQQLEDVPELIHRIQSLLRVEEAARTCILSKSWLHAWFTIPSLRFPTEDIRITDIEQHKKRLMMVEHMILRYIQDNLPFEKIYFQTYLGNHELGSLADKCIRLLSTRSYLKELELTIGLTISSFTFPYELFFGKNLIKMVIRCSSMNGTSLIISNVVISCVSLRVLELHYVHISDEALHSLLSTCSLLEKITLISCRGLKMIEVRNLCYLSELTIHQHAKTNILKIYDVPNIHSFCYSSMNTRNPFPFNICSLGNVTELSLDKVIMDDAIFDIIKSKFRFLESLTLGIDQWGPKSLDITCLKLKRLFLHLDWRHRRHIIKVQIYAPKLLFFEYDGMPMPSLMFSAIVPKQIKFVHRDFGSYVYDTSFFLKLREALMLTSEFDIQIVISRFDLVEPLNMISMDDIKRGVMFPAANVEHLSVNTYADTGLWDHSPFFDAFFLICHPKHVVAYRGIRFKDNNSFYKLMLKEVIEKKTRKGTWSEYLKEVEIKIDCNGGKWETLMNTWKNLLDGSSLVNCYMVEFRLNWLS